MSFGDNDLTCGLYKEDCVVGFVGWSIGIIGVTPFFWNWWDGCCIDGGGGNDAACMLPNPRPLPPGMPWP